MTNRVYANDLVDNTRDALPTWKGPYMPDIYPVGDSYFYVMNQEFTPFSIWGGVYMLNSSGDWAGGSRTCVDPSDCYEWIFFTSSVAKDKDSLKALFTTLDDYMDNNDGEHKGTVRLDDGATTFLMYRGIPRRY
ncbi:MAG: hypothetical protein GY793_06310 [Proteobacteria bacterium]|nr:hypothetical protein [Pseudomonadota bacterium]